MKSIFIWQGKTSFNSDLGLIAGQLKYLGVDRILIKIGDATNGHSRSFPDMKLAVDSFRAMMPSVEIWGWHYVYGGAYIDSLKRQRFDGHSPESEALFAISEVNRLRLDGYCIDAELEYKLGHNSSNRAIQPASRAGRFIRVLKPLGRSVPISLSSYRYPSYHPEFPWKTFLSEGVVTIHMPQVYWGNYEGAPQAELQRSLSELRKLADLPFHPVGRSYIGDGHSGERPKGIDVISKEIRQFISAAKMHQVDGVSFWVLDTLNNPNHKYGRNWAAVIAAADWESSPKPIPVPPPMAETWRCNALIGMKVRTGPSRSATELSDRIAFRAQFRVYERVFNDGLEWGRVDPTRQKWTALNWSVKES